MKLYIYYLYRSGHPTGKPHGEGLVGLHKKQRVAISIPYTIGKRQRSYQNPQISKTMKKGLSDKICDSGLRESSLLLVLPIGWTKQNSDSKGTWEMVIICSASWLHKIGLGEIVIRFGGRNKILQHNRESQ